MKENMAKTLKISESLSYQIVNNASANTSTNELQNALQSTLPNGSMDCDLQLPPAKFIL